MKNKSQHENKAKTRNRPDLRSVCQDLLPPLSPGFALLSQGLFLSSSPQTWQFPADVMGGLGQEVRGEIAQALLSCCTGPNFYFFYLGIKLHWLQHITLLDCAITWYPIRPSGVHPSMFSQNRVMVGVIHRSMSHLLLMEGEPPPLLFFSGRSKSSLPSPLTLLDNSCFVRNSGNNFDNNQCKLPFSIFLKRRQALDFEGFLKMKLEFGLQVY